MAHELKLKELRETRAYVMRCEEIDSMISVIEDKIVSMKDSFERSYEEASRDYNARIEAGEDPSEVENDFFNNNYHYYYKEACECNGRIEVLNRLKKELARLCMGK